VVFLAAVFLAAAFVPAFFAAPFAAPLAAPRFAAPVLALVFLALVFLAPAVDFAAARFVVAPAFLAPAFLPLVEPLLFRAVLDAEPLAALLPVLVSLMVDLSSVGIVASFKGLRVQPSRLHKATSLYQASSE
jgi:hypothetical protein